MYFYSSVIVVYVKNNSMDADFWWMHWDFKMLKIWMIIGQGGYLSHIEYIQPPVTKQIQSDH